MVTLCFCGIIKLTLHTLYYLLSAKKCALNVCVHFLNLKFGTIVPIAYYYYPDYSVLEMPLMLLHLTNLCLPHCYYRLWKINNTSSEFPPMLQHSLQMSSKSIHRFFTWPPLYEFSSYTPQKEHIKWAPHSCGNNRTEFQNVYALGKSLKINELVCLFQGQL
jgi:hypothetical protein